jgi:primary-amine oxidase
MTNTETSTKSTFPTCPLDPLSPDELMLVVDIVRKERNLDERALFEQVSLIEPARDIVRNFNPGEPVNRQALAVVLDRNAGKVYEAVVSLNTATLESWTHIPGVQACFMFEECDEMAAMVKKHPDFLDSLSRRGIASVDQVSVEGFAVANFGVEKERHLRLIRAHCFFVENPGDNPHVRPIEGLVPVVDLNAMKVLRIEDRGIIPIPPDCGDYRVDRLDHMQSPLATLEITQPDGPEFNVDGYAVSWQNWKFRVGFTPREGLVLHTLSFIDGECTRPVMYRASLSELVVPYGDTVGDHYMNHSFDLGEGVFGAAVNSLKLGCDCVGEIYYFDVNLVDGYGNLKHLPNAICMHEEDYGILWKHTDTLGQSTEVRRSRRLVVSSFFTIGNYDYGIFWYLYLDGTVEFEVKLTGMLYTRALEKGEVSPYGTIVAPGLSGMLHEHYFNIRLDMSVDGDENTLVEVEAARVKTGPSNPHGNAHGVTETVIESEQQSGRDINPANGRFWKVINRTRKNSLGWYPGYKLCPGLNVKPMHQPGSPFMRRAGFVAHDLWVTAFEPDQIFAPGNYLNQNEFGPGIPEWVEADRPLVDTNIVLWHTIGVLHVPRPEDFPVMPVEYAGFMLKPIGFFERNPALDIAPPGCHR